MNHLFAQQEVAHVEHAHSQHRQSQTAVLEVLISRAQQEVANIRPLLRAFAHSSSVILLKYE
jgi:hypothetical protein